MRTWLVFVLTISFGWSQVTPPVTPPLANWVGTSKLGPSCLNAGGFPASPKTIRPFVSNWQSPPESLPQPDSTAFPYSVEYQGRKAEYHEIHAVNQDIQIFAPGKPTKVLAYKLPEAATGTVPGPIIRVCKGVTTIVRYQNLIEGPDNRYRLLALQKPTTGNRGPGPDVCSTNYINPWPIQVYLHGSSSLAPYDGWADSLIYSGCGKDFIYPNNRAGISWYHDSALHETGFNAYHGLSSQYWVDDCCSEMEDTLPSGPYRLPFIVRDAVFDVDDQLFYDPVGIHRDSFYGDHVLVNGVPWPVLHVERRQYRFALSVVSISRAMHFSFNDQPGSYFLVIGSDGGFRQDVIKTNTLRAAVAERWDVIIDFAQPAFQGVNEVILYDLPLYNMPIFCQSHLVAKFIIDIPVTPTQFAPPPSFVTNVFTPIPPLPAPLPPSTTSPFKRPTDPLRPVTAGDQLLFFPKFQGTAPIPLINNHPLPAPLIPDSFITLAQDPTVLPRRRLTFGRVGGRWSISTIDIVNGAAITVGGTAQTWSSTDNGNAIPIDEQWTTKTGLPEHVTAQPTLNTLEVWEIVNTGAEGFHPVHIHLVDFFMAYRAGGSPQLTLQTGTDGLADYERLSAKDVVFLGPSETVRIIARYGPYGGNYMMHCHNLVHQDNEMLIGFKVIPSTGLIFNPTDPTFGGLDLPKDPQAPLDNPFSIVPLPLASLPVVDVNYLASRLQANLYRTMYPPEQTVQGYPVDWKAAPYLSKSNFIAPFVNPWEVPYTLLDRPEICPAFQALHTPAPGSTSFYAKVTDPVVVGQVVPTTLKQVKSKDKKMKVVVVKM